MLDALGSAGTQAAGLWEFNADGAMSKHLHPGKAAFNGMLSADLARAGFTGASRILEGDRGFFRATSESYDATRITDGLGARWKISENCYKLHSCCGHTHSAVDCALDLRATSTAPLPRSRSRPMAPGIDIVQAAAPADAVPGEVQHRVLRRRGAPRRQRGSGAIRAERFGPIRARPLSLLLDRTRVTVADDLTAKYPGGMARAPDHHARRRPRSARRGRLPARQSRESRLHRRSGRRSSARLVGASIRRGGRAARARSRPLARRSPRHGRGIRNL